MVDKTMIAQSYQNSIDSITTLHNKIVAGEDNRNTYKDLREHALNLAALANMIETMYNTVDSTSRKG